MRKLAFIALLFVLMSTAVMARAFGEGTAVKTTMTDAMKARLEMVANYEKQRAIQSERVKAAMPAVPPKTMTQHVVYQAGIQGPSVVKPLDIKAKVGVTGTSFTSARERKLALAESVKQKYK